MNASHELVSWVGRAQHHVTASRSRLVATTPQPLISGSLFGDKEPTIGSIEHGGTVTFPAVSHLMDGSRAAAVGSADEGSGYVPLSVPPGSSRGSDSDGLDRDQGSLQLVARPRRPGVVPGG